MPTTTRSRAKRTLTSDSDASTSSSSSTPIFIKLEIDTEPVAEPEPAVVMKSEPLEDEDEYNLGRPSLLYNPTTPSPRPFLSHDSVSPTSTPPPTLKRKRTPTLSSPSSALSSPPAHAILRHVRTFWQAEASWAACMLEHNFRAHRPFKCVQRNAVAGRGPPGTDSIIQCFENVMRTRLESVKGVEGLVLRAAFEMRKGSRVGGV